MSNKLVQSNKAKEEFTSLFLATNSINYNKDITRKDLIEQFNISDGAIRREVAKIANYYPVLSHSGKKGYRLAKRIDLSSKEELLEEMEIVKRVLAEDNSRIRQLKARQKPLIAWLKIAEKKIMGEL